MNNRLQQGSAFANYPQTATSASELVQPQPTGLHEGLAITRQRLNQVNSSLDSLLQRIHGPRPVSTGNDAKNPETPSVKQLGAHIES